MADRNGVPLGAGPDDDLTVIEVNKSAGDAIMKLLDCRKKKWDGDPEEDPTGPVPVRRCCGQTAGGMGRSRVGCSSLSSIRRTRRSRRTPRGMVRSISSRASRLRFPRSTSTTGEIYTPGMDPEQVANIFARWQFWFDNPEDEDDKGLIYIPTDEEKFLWLARGFVAQPKLFSYAMSDHPDLYGR